MKFCESHWEKLKKKIDDAGLGHLVAKDGAEVAERTLSGDPKRADPLLTAHNLIVANVLDSVGLALFSDNPDGTQRCPVCFAGEHCEKCKVQVEEWLDFAVRDVKEDFEREGVLKAPVEN